MSDSSSKVLTDLRAGFVKQLDDTQKQRTQLAAQVAQCDNVSQQLTGAITAMDIAAGKLKAAGDAPAAPTEEQKTSAPAATAGADASSTAGATPAASTDSSPAQTDASASTPATENSQAPSTGGTS